MRAVTPPLDTDVTRPDPTLASSSKPGRRVRISTVSPTRAAPASLISTSSPSTRLTVADHAALQTGSASSRRQARAAFI